MKKLLFVTAALGYGIGGSEKALAEMLKKLDTSRYEVTVICLTPRPEKPYTDDRIDVRYGYASFLRASTPFREILRRPWKYVPTLCFMRLKVALYTRFSKSKDKSGKIWDWYRPFVAPVESEYDVVVGYGQRTASYFAVDKVKAKHTVLWVDGDLRAARLDTTYMYRYYKAADRIVTVDPSGITRFGEIYPDLLAKTCCVRNIIPVEEIRQRAAQDAGFDDAYSGARILSVGRLCEAKAFHLAVDAAALLWDRGYEFRWYIIGFGPLEAPLREQIERLHLQDRFFLLGQKVNPYPYFAQTDIYAQTSAYEGSPLTIEEAMAFHKPIVTTNIPAAFEIIRDGQGGLITEKTPAAIADGVEKLLRDDRLREAMAAYTAEHPLDYDAPIKAFDELINELG